MKAAVQVDGTDNGLYRVGQDRITAKAATFHFTRPEPEILAQLELATDFSQGHPLNHPRPQAAELAFAGTLKLMIQVLGNEHVNQGIAEKLQTLIVLIAEAAVGQRQQQQLRVPELVANPALQPAQVGLMHHDPVSS